MSEINTLTRTLGRIEKGNSIHTECIGTQTLNTKMCCIYFRPWKQNLQNFPSIPHIPQIKEGEQSV